ncbi:hypothetical protein N7497_004059 [Penicillium chrysogenum]|uniref:Uncharacterized protein n=1 Tax=Penicillium chrysogenum TaxID=5076 RepID=A0ABQ8W9W0_PENCH|nr:hypothetical protein N7505_008462 [Penicillium chrysogenum]KAJ6159522.1 hypothetical protein N7497_004059 [Penicillium chrysogenum]
MFEEGQFEQPTIAISSLNIGDVQVLLKLTHSLDNLESIIELRLNCPPSADVAISVVMVETKGVESVTSGVSQTLGYIGCVHRRRKDL